MGRQMSLVVLVVAMGMVMSSTAYAGKATIYRDDWGVPHIYAYSSEDACYAIGYAQAEDRLEQIFRNYLRASGRTAEAWGPGDPVDESFLQGEWPGENVQHDYMQRICGHEEFSKSRYYELPVDVRRGMEYFQAGVNQYMKEHPDDVPEWAPELEPWQAIAVTRFIIFGWPLGEGIGDLRRGLSHPEPPPVDYLGSNQWAIDDSRSAEGCVITFIDPHVSWHDEFRWWEFDVHTPDWNGSGIAVVGTPLVGGLGHNDYCSFACTTGGPDTTDIYKEEVNPENPLQYKYDGLWYDMKVKKVVIKVEGGEDVATEIHFTRHGPIVYRDEKNNVAYSMAMLYWDDVHLATQMWMQNRATNIGEFRRALSWNSFMAQNIMYGDVDGNIMYVRTGRVPIRPEGDYNWRWPIPGNTSDTEWIGIHPMSDLVQITNPPQGYMQNNNCSPDTMMEHSPLVLQRYPFYIYQDIPQRYNPRAVRGVQLLSADSSVTYEEAKRIAMDCYIDRSDAWQEALEQGLNAYGGSLDASAKKVAQNILGWDGHAESESVGAANFMFWKMAITRLNQIERRLRQRGVAATSYESIYGDQPVDYGSIVRRAPLSEACLKALVQAVSQTAAYMEDKFDTVDVAYGRVHRARRGEHSWGLAGSGSSMAGMTALRNVGGGAPDDDGISWVRGGQSMTRIVLLKKGEVRSYSATPYGQSDHPESPHYADQGMKLFANKELKPTYYQKEELLQHLESTKIIDVPSL
jgi:acyl-homoserine-lactone acylase